MLVFDLAILLIIIHFAIPALYYLYIKNKKLDIKPENKEVIDVSIIIPTYNESDKIKEKIINLLQSYPINHMEVILVDSSDDNTAEIVKSFNIPRLTIIKEKERKGKIFAIKEGIKKATSNIVVITDADALWKDPLINVVSMFSSRVVGAVSCIKKANNDLENSYRNFYNTIRLGESALYSTPIFHGELTAFRKDIIKPDELPNVGADDSMIATLTTLKGYRAICIDNMRAIELAPKGIDYITWKMRRGSHLIRHFSRFLPKVLKSRNRKFKLVFLQEFYLHLINPWILIIGLILMAISNIFIFSILIFISILLSLLNSNVREILRAWIPNQLFLILSQIFSLRGEVLAWRKERK
ncbi:glycosyltransferase [Sulfolobus tengchongensis]|uniref:Glycosyltransferase n=1 Tax=Sulfolobus tengchongensis TaxID=207809 RepID=A0AAX4L411_9CREN